jgi:predicted DNA-binding transcriptional regulator YafY
VSVPQASNYLTLYQERAPQNAIYYKSAKRYVAGLDVTPVFLDPDPDACLLRLRSFAEGFAEARANWLGAAPAADVALTPRSKVDVAVLRSVLATVRHGWSLKFHYQSTSRDRPDPVLRRVTPHAFGYDGFRWHARAWCHETSKFKDFLLPRILGINARGDPGVHGA